MPHREIVIEKPKILIVEDDEQVGRLLCRQLEIEGFEALAVDTALGGLEAASEGRFDLVILDLGLPDASGFEVCKRLREIDGTLPIIVVTGSRGSMNKVRALDLGADDYLTKPYDGDELKARIRAVMRRAQRTVTPEVLKLGPLTIDTKRYEVANNGKLIQLTAKEFELLRILVTRQGEVVTRDEFLDTVWEGTYVTSRTVDTHIASLRKKIDDGDDLQHRIESVRGVGYKLRAAAGNGAGESVEGGRQPSRS